MEKRGPDRSSTPKKFSFDVKIAKIGPAYPEIICLREIIKKEDKKRKKKEITEGKIYSLVGKFAEQAKLCRPRWTPTAYARYRTYLCALSPLDLAYRDYNVPTDLSNCWGGDGPPLSPQVSAPVQDGRILYINVE